MNCGLNSELEKEIMEMASSLGIEMGEKIFLYWKRLFDENNIDVSNTHKSDAILTKLKRKNFFEVIDALRL